MLSEEKLKVILDLYKQGHLDIKQAAILISEPEINMEQVAGFSHQLCKFHPIGFPTMEDNG